VVSIHPVSDLASLLSLEQAKPDAYLGAGPVLGWGRIYGGQVVAQALRPVRADDCCCTSCGVASVAQEALARDRR
jgi:hypothetical protein